MIVKEDLSVDEFFLVQLEALNIFQNRSGMKLGTTYNYSHRFKVGDRIEFDRATTIEEYSTFSSGNRFFSSGSFSSLASTLPLGSKVGRYVSLARDLKPMGYRHPVEAVCMNSAVFNFSRENIASYFNLYENRNGVVNKKSVPTPQPQNAPIMVGNDVWIGSNVTIIGGVTIGTGAVIASDSIVTKDVEPYSIVAGSPARHRKYRFSDDVISGLLESQWWLYELGDLYKEELDFSNPDKFLNDFSRKEKKLNKLTIKKTYPYLYRYKKDMTLSNHVVDYHGSILYYDLESKKMIKSAILLSDLLEVKILDSIQGGKYFYVDGFGFIDFDNSGEVKFRQDVRELDYNVVMVNEICFYVVSNNRYLSSHPREDFTWKNYLKTWEYFYHFSQ